MPYILQKRSDIPAGLLQTLGITPNQSQRNQSYKPVAQTGYRGVPPNAAPSVTGGVFAAAATGLRAYLMANVSSGAGVKATANITTTTFANLADGDFFTVSDGTNTVIFGIKKTAAYAVPATRTTFSIVGLVTADNVRDALITAINASALEVTAVSGGAATVTMTNDNQNALLAAQNNTDNSDNVANAAFVIADFTGATASDSLTTAEATVDATEILALLGYGVSTAAVAINQAAINTMTTGNVTAAQVADILDILAGRNYVVPAAADVEVGGAFIPGLGAFDDTSIPFRRIYDTEALRISYTEGQLALARGSTFTYGGVTGAAVAVYADSGALYTV